MPTLERALAEATRALAAAGIEAPRRSAEGLLCAALGRERSYLYGHPEAELGAAEARFGDWIRRRAAGEPAQYLTGWEEFCGRWLAVTPVVLIPRPETEEVVAAGLERLPEEGRALDVGTGSGCIAVTLALERPRAYVAATDLSAEALEVARGNARALGAAVAFARGDLAAGFGGPFDLVISNPPYIAEREFAGLQREVREHEPRLALVSGESGMEAYARLIPQAARILKPGGWLALELGGEAAAGVVGRLGTDWEAVEVRRDVAGMERIALARRK